MLCTSARWDTLTILLKNITMAKHLPAQGIHSSMYQGPWRYDIRCRFGLRSSSMRLVQWLHGDGLGSGARLRSGTHCDGRHIFQVGFYSWEIPFKARQCAWLTKEGSAVFGVQLSVRCHVDQGYWIRSLNDVSALWQKSHCGSKGYGGVQSIFVNR